MAVTIGPIAVAASADDASEVGGTVSITANPLANCDTSGVWNAWRFTGITIPAGATITSAYLTINFTSTSLDEPDVTIYGLDVASPAQFTTDANNISSRARTTTSVNWANPNAGGNDVNTSDISSIITELITSYSYSNGVMGFCWTTRAADSTRDTSVTSYDGSTTECARLTIVYSAPSASVSPSSSRSPSISPSFSLSFSPSVSPSLSQSYSISPSVSVSISPSISPSYSVSPSISPSYSVSPSVSPSISVSISPSISPSYSVSPSISFSVSPSISPSYSISPSESSSVSVSESPSISPSAGVESESVSPSVSPSLSPSGSFSPSASPSPSIGVTGGDVCWGHDTGVLEDNVRDFVGNWYGTGAISGSGDAEQICLEAGEYMISEIVETGDQIIQLIQNNYAAGDDVVMKYRTGATPTACFDAGWIIYTNPFTSLGYVQIRLESTIGNLELMTSTDGRYFVTAGNIPFMMIGEDAAAMIVQLSLTEMETYMDNRQGYGINSLQVFAFGGVTYGGNSTTFETYDGIKPFSTNGDIDTVNETYFARVDAMLAKAAEHNMVVILDVADTIDMGTLWKNNGTTKCYNFGVYLGNRYKNTSNIIWCYGCDYQPTTDGDLDDCLIAIRDGIASEDTNHMHTLWTAPTLASRSASIWESKVDCDFVYSYATPSELVQTEWAKTPAKPVFFGEGRYEDAVGSTPLRMRKQAYLSTFVGALGGHFYCTGEYAWKFTTGWEDYLDSYPGLADTVTHYKTLMSNKAWYELVTDYEINDVLTGGYGTYNTDIDTTTLAICTYNPDGSLALIYMPSNLTMTIDMTEFQGIVTCRWFDPTNGTYTTDVNSPVNNTGPYDFSRPAANSGGDHDWVLVLEA